ncbi:MAG: hypothetical protein KAI66_00915 [Lentisphaeria bacterium]|nr:hypothetical protein [Lentisphaeria bacterium]
MIATAIFSLVLVILLGFSSHVTRTWESLRREETLFSELLALERALDSMFSNAVPFSWPSDENENESRPVFVGEKEHVRLTYLHRLNSAEDGAIRFVDVQLEEDELVAWHTERPLFNWEELSAVGQRTVLARNVSSIEFVYGDWRPDADADWGSRLEWVGLWEGDEDDKPREHLPLAIMLTVTWEDGRVESWLRRTAGQSYRRRFGKWAPRKDES